MQGSDYMAQETIQAVRHAELIAEQQEKQAVSEAKELIAAAEKEAKEIISAMTKKSLADAKKASDEALRQGEVMMQEARTRAEKEIALQQELLNQKEENAIQLVISELVG